jgi:hypothetical protein
VVKYEAGGEAVSAAAGSRAGEETQTVAETHAADSAGRHQSVEDGAPQTLPESAPAVAGKNRKRARRGEPDADDASLFDPQEVGFATIVAQLDELTDPGLPRRRKGRVVN